MNKFPFELIQIFIDFCDPEDTNIFIIADTLSNNENEFDKLIKYSIEKTKRVITNYDVKDFGTIIPIEEKEGWNCINEKGKIYGIIDETILHFEDFQK